MPTVFVSYSHGDSAFVERLIADLRLSDIQATYDKWILNVGDSILLRLAAEVSAADSVIAVLSPRSVESAWVRKELALAMASEMNTARIKVLPALLEDCALPDMLIDKFYADFRHEYYEGLFALLNTLRPRPAAPWMHRHVETRAIRRELGNLLGVGDIDDVSAWLLRNPAVFTGLVGYICNVFEIIPRVNVGGIDADFVIVNGRSGRYDVSLIFLGPLTLQEREIMDTDVDGAVNAVQWCHDNDESFRRSIAIRLSRSHEADVLFPGTRRSQARSAHLDINAKIIVARRSEYGSRENEWRNDVYQRSRRDVDIISYDRLVDLLESRLARESKDGDLD